MSHPDLDRVVEALASAHRVAVVLHEMPDGDCAGSGLGLRQLLEAGGRSVEVLAPDPVPPPYRFLPGAEDVKTWETRTPGTVPCDVVVTVDCGDPARCLGLDRLRALAPVLVNIDHHVSNRRYGDVNWVDGDRVAVGEMILTLADRAGWVVTPAAALCLYVSLVMDTEGLLFGFHNAAVLEQAARLVRLGIDPHAVSRRLLEDRSPAALRALGWALSQAHFSPSGRVAWIALPADVMARFGVAPYETEGWANFLRGVRGVQLAAFLREEPAPAAVRVSLRSQPPWEARAVAERLGGGGHRHAAGARLAGPLDSAVTAVLRAVADVYGEVVAWTDSWPS